MIWPTVMRGLSDEYGSWKIAWIWRRTTRISLVELWVMSAPANSMPPPVASSSLRMVRPTVVLPQPDSPTSPNVSPGAMVNDTSSTAFTVAVFDDMKPAPAALTVKYLSRPATSKSGLPLCSLVVVAAVFPRTAADTSAPSAISCARQQAERWSLPTACKAGS